MIAWSIAAVAGKAVVYATCLVAGGGILFLAIFAAQLQAGEHRYVVRLVRTAAAIGMLAAAARIATLSGMLGGGDLASALDGSLIRIVLESSEGPAAAARFVGLLVVAAFGFGQGNATQVLSVIGALAAVGSFAFTGHASAIGPGDLPKLLAAAHLLAVAYWIGALAPLLKLAASSDLSRVGAILERFGNIAILAVAALATAGAVLLWLLTASVDEILASPYGRLVLLKVALVAGLLTLAAMNKRRLTPAVAAGSTAAVKNLRRSIAGEMLLAAAILVVTATFTTVTGPPVLE